MPPTLKRYSFTAMGSSCEIQVFDKSRINARQLLRKLSEEVNRLENKYSRYREDSLLSEINNSAGNSEGIAIDQETSSLFDHALSCFNQSDGLFDITAGVLNRAWDFRNAHVPPQDEIETLLPRVGFDRLSWQDSRLLLPAGMEIDFGGIVKEYAADAVAKLGRSLGIRNGLVNLGGDFAVIGPQLDDRPWNIGITNPDKHASVMASIDLRDGGLASSGDYERAFEYEGKRYSHILNPKTGWPCSGLRAVSVAANLCTVAGSMATIAMLKEESEAIAWLQQSTLPHVFMTAAGRIESFGLRDTLEST